jgi:hypothetical protein
MTELVPNVKRRFLSVDTFWLHLALSVVGVVLTTFPQSAAAQSLLAPRLVAPSIRVSDDANVANLAPARDWILTSGYKVDPIVVSSTTPEMLELNLAKGHNQSHILFHPELQNRVRSHASPGSGTSEHLLVYAVARDQFRNVYGAVAPYPLDHAVIIKFTPAGEVLGTLNLELPVARTLTKPGKYFAHVPPETNLAATMIGVSPDGSQLFLYSEMHNKIAVYDIGK